MKHTQEGLADNTIIFYFSDHVGALGRGKRFLYESGLHVPLIIRVPKKLLNLASESTGERTDRLVSFIDFAPAVLSLAGIEVPEYMPGKPFLGRKADKYSQYSLVSEDGWTQLSILAVLYVTDGIVIYGTTCRIGYMASI